MLIRLATDVAARLRSDRGANAVEYGLMVGLISIAIIGAVSALGGYLGSAFDTVADMIANVGE